LRVIINFIILFLFVSSFAYSQTAPGKYWVQFKDKKSNPYSINNPHQFLSQKSLERRQKQQILVDDLDLPVNRDYIDSVSNKGAVVINRSRWFNAVTVEINNPSILDSILSLPFVLQVKRANKLVSGQKHEDKWGQVFTYNIKSSVSSDEYGSSDNQIEMLSGKKLHEEGYRGSGKVIAVIDAGFYNVDILPAFENLWQNNRILGTRDFVTGDTMVFEDHPHGTYVLSTMGGYIPGSIIGTAPEASYWLLRSEDAATEYVIEEDNWIAAAEFADSVGADIINSSLGYTTYDDPSQSYYYADMNGTTARVTIGADIAASKGILVVNSAGNSGSSSWRYIGAPADGIKVFAIGAVDAGGNYALFSSKGPTYDGRIKPNVVAQGQGTIVASLDGGIMAGNGTSFSSPVMAGMIACLWQAHPYLTNLEVMKAVERSAHQYLVPDSLMGYGIPNFAFAHSWLKDTLIKYIDDDFIVYPNPVKDLLEIIIFSDKAQTVIIEILDMHGKKIFKRDLIMSKDDYSRIGIPEVQSLNQGLYFISVTKEDKTIFRKFIKS
jgi:serine protease AprX